MQVKPVLISGKAFEDKHYEIRNSIEKILSKQSTSITKLAGQIGNLETLKKGFIGTSERMYHLKNGGKVHHIEYGIFDGRGSYRHELRFIDLEDQGSYLKNLRNELELINVNI